ncbi:hypothetical protein CXF83_06665 [Shewanella sp. Choline-02u-19]|nr:hypothetical protein CXF82_15850 [Shewanella sp. GutDb-MelDb]PKH56758.1 hypothetical protein CXF84_12685 [Shewanella sp. Bg11-22]PKI30309.1 hypothetical protein CXF83_06665 [Shewanella sp. Choline-02u-19]
MTRAKKFKLLMIVQLIVTVMYKTIPIELTYYMNSFFIVGMALGAYLILKAIVYACPNCGKHQIMLGFFKYRLPTDNCYVCCEKIDS